MHLKSKKKILFDFKWIHFEMPIFTISSFRMIAPFLFLLKMFHAPLKYWSLKFSLPLGKQAKAMGISKFNGRKNIFNNWTEFAVSFQFFTYIALIFAISKWFVYKSSTVVCVWESTKHVVNWHFSRCPNRC